MLDSDRTFQLWEYRAGHGKLLVRSPRGPAHDENVDLRFIGVEFLSVPRFLRGLRVERGDCADVREAASAAVRDVDGAHVYRLESDGVRHLVVAQACLVEHHARGIFWSPFGIWPAPSLDDPGEPECPR